MQHFQPSNAQALKLMMEGSKALADVEQHGMRIDVDYLDSAIAKATTKIRELEGAIKEDEVWQTWRKVYGSKANLGSNAQLAQVIFGELGVECKVRTKTGRPKTDAEALEGVDFPFVRKLVNLEKLKKARSTYLVGLRSEVVDGFVHPFFHLHLATTFRSSSSNPNLQNQPIRDKRQAKLIRQAFVPRSADHVLVEIDYSALEFKGAANFWLDPGMVAYASDPSLDIHRDMGAECYRLATDQVSKNVRSYAKNQFVFPTLYGSYYKNTGIGLWASIAKAGLTTADGVPLQQHLEQKSIFTEEDFIAHIRGVEQRFNERFPAWSEKKEKWWQQYLENGWFPLSTGFVCAGVFSYNNLMNTPIQGPSFHCLLWSLIELNKWLKQCKMRSRIICQIHDSILADVHRSELADYLVVAKRIMTEDIRKHWDWIVTPLWVEAEVAESNWFEKKVVAI